MIGGAYVTYSCLCDNLATRAGSRVLARIRYVRIRPTGRDQRL